MRGCIPGQWPAIIEKDKDHHSSLYDDAWMPNMQRITWNIGIPIIHAHVCMTPTALSPGASGNPAKRVVTFKSSTKPHSISMASASSVAADQIATPYRAPLRPVATSSVLDETSSLANRPAGNARA